MCASMLHGWLEGGKDERLGIDTRCIDKIHRKATSFFFLSFFLPPFFGIDEREENKQENKIQPEREHAYNRKKPFHTGIGQSSPHHVLLDSPLRSPFS